MARTHMTHIPQDFHIGPNDTIIVLRENGTCDASFPELEGNQEVPEHIVTAAAILHALEDDDLSEMIHESFATQCEEYAYMDASNDN